MKSWDQVIKEALYMHVHKDEYAYFYGAKGQKLTDAVMEALWEAEPEYFKRYDEKQKKAIFKYSRNKTGYDCSGFIGKITGCNTYSGAIWSRCSKKTADLYAGPAASILWKPGHVALDIGYGFGIEAAVECSSIEMFRISEQYGRFQQTGQLVTYIDYTGATNR